MSFDTEVLKDGRGRVIRLDFSVDSFATVLARYGTHAGKLDGTNFYEPRVVSVGTLSRGFGVDHIAASGTVDVVIENTDGVADWLASRDGIGDLATLRVRVYVGLFDPSAPTSFSAAQLGEFSLASWPKRNNTSVHLQLADDIFASFSNPPPLPTPADWFQTGTISTNPLKDQFTCGYDTQQGTGIQLAFGEDWVRCHDPILPHTTNAAWPGLPIVIPVCTCVYDATPPANEITNLRVILRNPDGSVNAGSPTVDVPRTFTYNQWGGSLATATIWTEHRSDEIVIHGKSLQIIWVEVRCTLFAEWARTIRTEGMNWGSTSSTMYGNGKVQNPAWPSWNVWLNGYSTYTPDSTTVLTNGTAIFGKHGRWENYVNSATRVAEWHVKGSQLSNMTTHHACDTIADIAEYYAEPTMTVDSTTRTRISRSAFTSRAAGVISAPWGRAKSGEYSQQRSLRAEVSAICQSADIDVFINKSGQLAFSAYGNDEEILNAITNDTLVRIDEERLVSFEDWIPGEGERGAPYNVVTLAGARSNWAENRDVPPQGPWVLDTTYSVEVPSTSKYLPVTIQQGWRPWAQMIDEPLQWRHLETRARPRVRFVTDLSALRLELGDFFRLTWGRNVSPAVYDAAVFQVETINYSPDSDGVEVEAIWRDEVVTERGYLLDNQTYLLVVASAGGRTATVSDSSSTVTFSSGDLNADGVVAGDTLVLLDATQGAAEFSRFRALLISAVDAYGLDLTVNDADLDFGGGLAVATWEIRRGATTYPTSITDPTNYPTGGEMYGKVADEGTERYADGSGPNYLLDG